MSKGNIYCIVLLLLSAILSSAHTIKAATTFQAVNNNEGLCKYIPLLKNIGNRAKWKTTAVTALSLKYEQIRKPERVLEFSTAF